MASPWSAPSQGGVPGRGYSYGLRSQVPDSQQLCTRSQCNALCSCWCPVPLKPARATPYTHNTNAMQKCNQHPLEHPITEFQTKCTEAVGPRLCILGHLCGYQLTDPFDHSQSLQGMACVMACRSGYTQSLSLPSLVVNLEVGTTPLGAASQGHSPSQSTDTERDRRVQNAGRVNTKRRHARGASQEPDPAGDTHTVSASGAALLPNRARCSCRCSRFQTARGASHATGAL